jgi:hypothetical protein
MVIGEDVAFIIDQKRILARSVRWNT